MFDSPYNFQKVAVNETLATNPTKKIYFKFKAKHRTYFVTLEVYSFDIVAIKYCDVKDKDSKNAYRKIFNDHDGFRVITTCLYIMLDYWKTNPTVTFAFYAVPRDFNKEKFNKKFIKEIDEQLFIEKYKKVRFNIYRYAMVNLFPPQNFVQLRDTKNCLYILLNKKQKKPKTTIDILGKYLLANYDMIFELAEE
jgi:hypothetical protein